MGRRDGNATSRLRCHHIVTVFRIFLSASLSPQPSSLSQVVQVKKERGLCNSNCQLVIKRHTVLLWNFHRLFGQCAQGEDPGCWNARRGPGRRLKHPARILFNIQVWTDRSLIIAAASSSTLVSGAGRQMGEMWRRRRVMFPLHCGPARLGNLPKIFHRDIGVLP